MGPWGSRPPSPLAPPLCCTTGAGTPYGTTLAPLYAMCPRGWGLDAGCWTSLRCLAAGPWAQVESWPVPPALAVTASPPDQSALQEGGYVSSRVSSTLASPSARLTAAGLRLGRRHCAAASPGHVARSTPLRAARSVAIATPPASWTPSSRGQICPLQPPPVAWPPVGHQRNPCCDAGALDSTCTKKRPASLSAVPYGSTYRQQRLAAPCLCHVQSPSDLPPYQ